MTPQTCAPNQQTLSHGEELARQRTAKGLTTSAFGVKVATIIGAVWHGLHHFPTKHHYDYIRLPIWADERNIRIVLHKGLSLSTWDFDQLTALVILAHEFCVRLDIEAATVQQLALNFHPRDGREGSIMRRHPDIAEAVKRWAPKPAATAIPAAFASSRLGVDARLGAVEDDGPTEVRGYGHGV